MSLYDECFSNGLPGRDSEKRKGRLGESHGDPTDVIVSDVMIPVMNGIECCEALKMDERTAHIPVILLTALAEERQQLEGYGAGADDYLPKPFSLAVLKAKIKNLLKRSEQLSYISGIGSTCVLRSKPSPIRIRNFFRK